MRKFFIITTACIATMTTAHAEFLTGNDLLARINGDAYDSILASGYVAGAYDTLRTTVHCSPEGVTIGQIKDMVKKHLESNPGVRQLSADMHVRYVLEKAWPCPKKNNGSGV